MDPINYSPDATSASAAATAATAFAAAEAAAFRNAELTLQTRILTTERGRSLEVTLRPPEEGTRGDVVFLAILDISGSMGEVAGGAPGSEEACFTRLDLVKHAVRTIAALLGPTDQLGIVTFSTDARTVLQPVPMTPEGRAQVETALLLIHPDASTNIFAGIREAAAIANRPAFAESNVVAMLLTDGHSNINPPRGILPSLAAGTIELKRPWSLTTFGFGYSLDSALLANVAAWGKGLFGFIPDCSMVGTLFINAMAHALSIAHRGTTFSFNGTVVETGPIAFGQPRTWLFDLGDEEPVVTFEGQTYRAHDTTDDPYLIAYHDLCNTLTTVLTPRNRTESTALLEAFYDRHHTSTDRRVQALVKDVSPIAGEEGQVHMAPDYFTRWGEHYMRAYLRAQQLQQCMNFKDPGLQIYGGDMFHRIQEEGDRLFCTLPAPTPTGRGSSAAAAPSTMAQFHNASAGCFAAETLIRLADGSQQRIAALAPGMRVATPTGPATIRALVTCGTQQRAQPMTQIGYLLITPWHPIRIDGVWQFPADVGGFRDRLVQVVYNLVLDRGHIVYADGYEACTLAHGFNDSPVIQHDFFGTERVLMDLAQVPGWANGRPTFQNLVAIRDEATGVICGWRDMPF
jgi:Mg-chelatase subunit ChlD